MSVVMGIVNYISSHFNRYRTLPGSLKVMRVIAMCGIAIAAATLVVTLSILKGFEREYRRTILDFNAHVVMMKAGEVEDATRALDLINISRSDAADKKFVQDNKVRIFLWNMIEGLYENYVRWHARAYDKAPIGSRREALLEKMKPPEFPSLVPEIFSGFRDKTAGLKRKGVIGVTPFIYREGLMISHGVIKGIIVKGIDADSFRQVNPMRVDLVSGYHSLKQALDAELESPPVIIGVALARQLGIEGLNKIHKVQLLVPTQSLVQGEKHFRELSVVGMFESGLYDYDAQFALMSMPRVRSLFDVGGQKITGIELKLDDPEKAAAMSRWMERQLMGSWRVIPWSELNAEIFRAVEIEKRTFSIVMGMLMIVASFNIIGVLVLIIIVRSHEISLLRSLGMTKRQLTRVFTRGGLFIGLTGVIIGLVLGVGVSIMLAKFDIVRIAPEIYFLSRLPIDISSYVCGMIAVFCLLVCWGSSRSAAKRLADIPISEGLSKSY